MVNKPYLMSEHTSNKIFRKTEESENFFRVRKIVIEQYEEEWNELYRKENLDIRVLRQKSVDGNLKNSYFRSICWRCLLGILHKQPVKWLQQLQTSRNHYNVMSVELDKNPWNTTENIQFDNPLSQDTASVWQKYFYDEELKGTIYQDVKRTFPDVSFFRSEDVQKLMVRILFCYAKQNPALCYRQGMHEVLAPLILVLYCDQEAYSQAVKQNAQIDEDIGIILSPDFLEQDVYSIFKHVMSHIQCSYKLNPEFIVDYQKEEYKTEENEVIMKLDYIKRNIFQKQDPELNNYLEKLDIPMHLFGIRWLRLLFGHEFSFQNLLILWDFLFANNFCTINETLVAMLVAIRDILLVGNYTDCLSVLMKYPDYVSVDYVIAIAMHLKNPNTYPLPETMGMKSIPTGSEGINLLQQQRLKSNGLKKWFSVKPSQLKLNPSGDTNSCNSQVTDFKEYSRLETELEQSKMIMNIVHHKLLQFHSILKANLHSNTNPELNLVVDGLYKLSGLLEDYNNCKIDIACEADENEAFDSEQLQEDPSVIEKTLGTACNETPKTVCKKKKFKSGELTVFKYHVGGSMSGIPMIDPLCQIKN